MASPWFPGAGRDEADETFLVSLRAEVDVVGFVDATSERTSLHVWDTGLVLLVEIPGLQDTEARPTLEVIFDVQRAPTLMCGCETYGFVADAYDEMHLAGVERVPATLGRQAARWFAEQLRRPVEELIWSTWRGQRSLVRFADTAEPIWWDSGAWRRRDRHPDRVLVRRPCA